MQSLEVFPNTDYPLTYQWKGWREIQQFATKFHKQIAKQYKNNENEGDNKELSVILTLGKPRNIELRRERKVPTVRKCAIYRWKTALVAAYLYNAQVYNIAPQIRARQWIRIKYYTKQNNENIKANETQVINDFKSSLERGQGG